MVLRLDHVYLEVDDPEEVHARLAELLGASIVWPVTDYGLFHSGGLSLRTFVLEIVRFAESSPTPPRAITGVALAPSDPAAELTTQPPVIIGTAEPFGPVDAPWWTNTPLLGVVDSARVFVCDYSSTFRALLDSHRATFAGSAALQLSTPRPERDGCIWQQLGLAAGGSPLQISAGEQEMFSLRISLRDDRVAAAEAYTARAGLGIRYERG